MNVEYESNLKEWGPDSDAHRARLEYDYVENKTIQAIQSNADLINPDPGDFDYDRYATKMQNKLDQTLSKLVR
jgi:hypothetical protein